MICIHWLGSLYAIDIRLYICTPFKYDHYYTHFTILNAEHIFTQNITQMYSRVVVCKFCKCSGEYLDFFSFFFLVLGDYKVAHITE